jgi:hypothetical protein
MMDVELMRKKEFERKEFLKNIDKYIFREDRDCDEG